jgi:hypothetical protein
LRWCELESSLPIGHAAEPARTAQKSTCVTCAGPGNRCVPQLVAEAPRRCRPPVGEAARASRRAESVVLDLMCQSSAGGGRLTSLARRGRAKRTLPGRFSGPTVYQALLSGPSVILPDDHKQALCTAPNAPKMRPNIECLFWVCAVTRRRFPVGASPTRRPLQPEAAGAAMEVTKWLKPSECVSRIGDSASVQAVTRVNAEQASKRTMRRPTR